MDKKLINNNDNSTIDNSRIVSNTDKGIVTSNKKCWYFVPKDKITEKTEYDNGYYYTYDTVSTRKKGVLSSSYYTDTNPVETSYTEKARYYFGLKDIKLFNSSKVNNSGIISGYIALSNLSYITVNSVESGGENYSTEYYILDGLTEVSVLPENQELAVKERLFYNTSLRFPVDSTVATTLYEDGVEISKNYLELTYDDYENHIYALTYKPGGDPYRYIPENTNVRVKIIIRCYNDESISPNISGIVINKYGGKVEWN